MTIDQDSIAAFKQTPEYELAQDSYQQLLARAATDMDFRERLKSDPHAAIEEFGGEELPESYKNLDLRFVENEGDVTVVLPDPIRQESELSEEELEAVAGGVVIVFVSSTACAAVGSALVSAIFAS